MRTITFCLILLALAGVSFAVTSTRPSNAGTVTLLIDNFDEGNNNVVIQISGNTNFPVVASDIYPKNSSQPADQILGGERDLTLEVVNSEVSYSLTNSYITQDTSNGQTFWDVSTPGGTSAISYLQYDGKDGDAIHLAQGGLGSLNLQANGGLYVHVVISNDVSTEYDFLFVTPGGTQCEFTLSLPGTDGDPVQTDYFMAFSEFSNQGTCFTQVGAIQATGNQAANVDAQMYQFEIVGQNPTPTSTATATPVPSSTPTATATATATAFPSSTQTATATATATAIPASQSNTRTPTSTNTATAQPSQSRTPTPLPSQSRTPTPAPSQSRTPTPAPSQSRTPTQTPTPSRTPSPECICHCPAFTCALIFNKNDDVNNVYYFSGNGFTRPVTTGGLHIKSSASLLSASFAVIALIAALF